jgi:hypothetical protein
VAGDGAVEEAHPERRACGYRHDRERRQRDAPSSCPPLSLRD